MQQIATDKLAAATNRKKQRKNFFRQCGFYPRYKGRIDTLPTDIGQQIRPLLCEGAARADLPQGNCGRNTTRIRKNAKPPAFCQRRGFDFLAFFVTDAVAPNKKIGCAARGMPDFYAISPILCSAAGEKFMNHNNRRMMLTNWKMLPSRTKMCQTQCIYPFFLPMA